MFCINDNLCSRLIEIQIPKSHWIEYVNEKRETDTDEQKTNMKKKIKCF